MSDKLVAHSTPKEEPERGPHYYTDHVRAVQQMGLEYARAMFVFARFSVRQVVAYLKSLGNALRMHDVGKLETGNQAVLRGERTGRLPYDHVDGGVAVAQAMEDTLAAWLVRAHHAPGLASYKDEKKLKRRLQDDNLLRGMRYKRDSDKETVAEHLRLIQQTNELIDDLVATHETSCGEKLNVHATPPPTDALATRLLLSCLVDADHGDTAAYYNGIDDRVCYVEPKWQLRLEQLQNVVGRMQGEDADRQVLRDELFKQCLNADFSGAIATCAAPVGLGKTTAVTANLLKNAIERKLRRIFIIAPFTNIISQTADRLRRYLVLDGEDPFEVVAEHHHRAEFGNAELRQYAQRWQAPIVVTTAVQFFETLASASPVTLRKLHALPGSAVFIDEAHACVPPRLMRQAWFWVTQLAENWSCYFVLASGSLVKFWEEPGIVGSKQSVILPSVLRRNFFQRAQVAERRRIHFARLEDGKAIGKEVLLNAICSENMQGSQLIILNTVQSAAVVAEALQRRLQPDINDVCPLSERIVLHISTALAPIDRERIIKELTIRQQRNNSWQHRDWYLVATSCVEAGVDLDFDLGFRERCSLTSYLQTAGRINRESVNPSSVLYDFALVAGDGSELLAHPAFTDAIAVFDLLWDRLISGEVDLDSLSTSALIRELQRAGGDSSEDLYKNEKSCNFQHVQKDFKIITSDTLTAIVNDEIHDALVAGKPVNYRQIQKHSVQVWRNKFERFGVTPIDQRAGLYKWNYEYDANFLGYMRDLDKMIRSSGWVV